MRKIEVKIGAAIVLYSLIITIAIIFGFYFLWYAGSEKVSDLPRVLIRINVNFIVIGLCLIIIVSSLALWSWIKKIEQRKTQEIRQELSNLEQEPFYPMSNDFNKEYNHLKSRFDENLNDYKRLNSYITHEQKNVITLMQAILEARGDVELLAELSQLSKSIDDVLTISSTSANDVEPVDVSLVVASVSDGYRRIYKDIDFDFDDDEIFTIMAKAQWIERAVSNLMDNAVKFGKNRLIRVLLKKEKGCVIISVQDSGIGIDEAMYERIFDTNYRIRELNKDGYGIGLSLVEHVCDLCNGFVWVESKKGVGTTFYLSFPQA